MCWPDQLRVGCYFTVKPFLVHKWYNSKDVHGRYPAIPSWRSTFGGKRPPTDQLRIIVNNTATVQCLEVRCRSRGQCNLARADQAIGFTFFFFSSCFCFCFIFPFHPLFFCLNDLLALVISSQETDHHIMRSVYLTMITFAFTGLTVDCSTLHMLPQHLSIQR